MARKLLEIEKDVRAFDPSLMIVRRHKAISDLAKEHVGDPILADADAILVILGQRLSIPGVRLKNKTGHVSRLRVQTNFKTG